jgi:hypothetical protein
LEVLNNLEKPSELKPSSNEERKPRRILGLRASALVEIGLFLSLSLALDYFFLDGTRFWEWAPHPFWVIVVLVTCQYGTNEGLVSAGLASLALLVYNFPEQSLSQDVYDHLLEITKRPLMWACCGVFLGGLRNRQIEERDQLSSDLAETKKREENIASGYEKIRSLKRKLEARLAGQVSTAATLYNSVKAIEKLEPEEVLNGVVDVLRSLLNPDKFSLFLLNQNRLELSIADGWSPEDSYSQSFTANSPIFQRIVGEQKLLCVSNEEEEKILEEEGLLAGPLMDPESGEVLGMLKIEEIGFVDLNLGNLETFRVVCEWLATAYRNAQRYQKARSQSMISEQTTLYSYGFFVGHKDFFVELAKRMGFRLSMLVVKLNNAGEMGVEELKEASLALKDTVSKVLRKTDLAFDHSRTGQEYAIVLPGASPEDAIHVQEKLASTLETRLGDLSKRADFSFSAQPLHTDTTARTLLQRELFESRLDFLMRLQSRVPMPITIALVELAKTEQLTVDEQRSVSGLFRKTVSQFLQEYGFVYFGYQRSDSVITVVLPSETVSSSQKVTKKLSEMFENEVGTKGPELNYSFHLISPPEPSKVSNVQETLGQAERLLSAIG